MSIVIDSSAVLAIMLDEPEGEELSELGTDVGALMSAGSLLESSIVAHSRAGADAVDGLDRILRSMGVRTVAVSERQALLAREAFVRYGKGNHPAALNFGDCFSYALAKDWDLPLLFKGDDFSQTDIASARA